MTSHFYCPRLEIIPLKHSPQNVDLIGKIKSELNFDLIKDSLCKNEECVKFFSNKSYYYFPLKDYYSDAVKSIFDIYGGELNIDIDENKFVVRLYFYSMKNPELLTKDIILKFEQIFKQSNFINTNMLNPEYHNYRMKIFSKDIETKFFNIDFIQPLYCKSQLYLYQRHNINWMLKIHQGIKLKFSQNLQIKFDLGLIYDMVAEKFIEDKDIPEYNIHSGILMDEPGVGKTLQIIVFLIEILSKEEFKDKRALILVPDNLKSHWENEFQIHITYNLSDLPIDILTHTEINKNHKILSNYAIHIYDELHIIYRSHLPLFTNLIESKIKYKWGLTSTPFISDVSMWHLLNLLVGKKFMNERICYNPEIQTELAKVFLKNTKNNTIKEHEWPKIVIIDNILELDGIQQTAYDTDSKSITSIDKLMRIASDIMLRYDGYNYDIQTPKELKETINDYYKDEYEKEVKELKDIENKLKKLEEYKEILKEEYFLRHTQLINMLKKKTNDVRIKKSAYEYFINSINKINGLVNAETDYDEVCAICMNSHKLPLSYIKKCGHYFCEECFVLLQAISCPICRTQFNKKDIINIRDKYDIILNSKYARVYELLQETDDKFIIFTKYPEIIQNLLRFLRKYNIDAVKYSNYIGLTKQQQDDVRVVILSSEDSSSGLDFSSKNRVIIYEPFQDHIYSKEIEKQLIGRVHRLKQTKPVYVYRLIMDKTIEKEIYSKYITN